MAPTTLINFEADSVHTLLTELGIKTKKIKGKEFVLTDEGDIERCQVCKHEVTPETVGNIAKGSNKIFCDNPICFISYLEENQNSSG